jgi:glycosyltransferase involved in cell wall biosynthesis
VASKSDTQNYWSLAAGQKPGSLGIAEYSLAIPELEIKHLLNFRRLHLAIWQMRTHDLQTMFDIDTEHGRVGYLAWCVSAGMSEYKALAELKLFCDELSSVADIPATEWSSGISRLIQLAIFSTPHLNISYELKTEQEQLEALIWYFCSDGFRSFPTPNGIPDWQKDFLINNTDFLASRLAQLFYKSRPDVRAAFNLGTASGVEGFRHWMATHGLAESGLNNTRSNLDTALLSSTAPEESSAKTFGVNLIGYAFGELGIGEDVRMAARSLHAAGVPFTVLNFEPGNSIRQADRSIEQWVSSEYKYTINIFCLTAIEHFRFYAENGKNNIEEQYNIGYWPWELELWPSNWNHCFSLINEMWASSRHILSAIAGAGFNNTEYMPMAVSVKPPNSSKKNLRKRFGIAQNSTAFVFSFDGNSSYRRKNPLAVLEAFEQAFKNGNENACLVIKCMRTSQESSARQKLLSSAKKDNRIIIIDEVMTKDELTGLYAACDCFVSLHRAEGFGRAIAEAFLLGMHVIATAYSGNLDYCEHLGANLVSYTLTETSEVDYVEGSGNRWAEPNVPEAALQMVRIHERFPAVEIGAPIRSSAKAVEIFSPKNIGIAYRERILRLT